MSDVSARLPHPPIVEAIVDIDCSMAPDFDLAAIADAAKDRFAEKYPQARKRHYIEHTVEHSQAPEPQLTTRRGLRSLQFTDADSRQVVQVRSQGYSFNRLAPYEGLDSYLPEIQRTWRLFVAIARPEHVTVLRLRFINRILVPLIDGQVNLDEYFRTAPRLPAEESMALSGFMVRNEAVDSEVGAQVVTVLASQPEEHGLLPVVLDITVGFEANIEASDWTAIAHRIAMLRSLKNRIFRGTLEEKCLDLFQ